MNAAARCPWAIRFGTTLTTRCLLDDGHLGLPIEQIGTGHVGRGLKQFPHQRIEWFAGDRREFRTERDDRSAWEEPVTA